MDAQQPHSSNRTRYTQEEISNDNAIPGVSAVTNAAGLGPRTTRITPEDLSVAVSERSLGVPIAEVVRNHHGRLARVEEKVTRLNCFVIIVLLPNEKI